MSYHIPLNSYPTFFFGEEAREGQKCDVLCVNNPSPGEYYMTVKKKYYPPQKVYVHIQPNGMVDELNCNCQYAYGHCRHGYAALTYLKGIFDEKISNGSSRSLVTLLQEYTRQISDKRQEPVGIEPALFLDTEHHLRCTLRVGQDKKYLIRDISQFMEACLRHEHKAYGKKFEWTHSLSALDDKSRQLAVLANDICQRARGSYRIHYGVEREFPLQAGDLESFLRIFPSDTLMIDKQVYTVEQKEPRLRALLESIQQDKVRFWLEKRLTDWGCAEHGYFFSEEDHILYVTSRQYAEAAAPLLRVFADTASLVISRQDIGSFFTTILRQIEPYFEIDMTGVKENALPPQLVSQLYIDVNQQGVICAMLQFSYGERYYSAFQQNFENPYADRYGEELAKEIVCRYFVLDSSDVNHPLKAADDDAAFRLINEGMSELTKHMEVYVSDWFRAITVRKPVQANVGIKPSGNLLEVDISAVGYTVQELAEMLDAYRKGRKYYRFRDGSFSVLDERVQALDLFTKEMNFSDKDLLRENITVPLYRMLYLNSLQAEEDVVRLKRSTEFKQYAKAYENTLRDEERLAVPVELDGVLRDYQQYGFRWMKALGLYHMGGILADDMGLGKTLQAIALMLSEKQSTPAGETRQFLVVCPSSLTLNWLSEIARFAPQLKALCLSGTVAERNKLFEMAGDYDVLITSYATLLRDIDRYESLHFAVQFLDEAQNIKNHTTQSAKAVKVIRSDLRFALTGTPVENSLAELWSIFDFIMPGYLHTYRYFQKTYESPIVKQNDALAVRSLQRMTSPFILRRLKKEVLTELPDKTETVLLTEMEDTQKKIYLAHALQAKQEMVGMDSQRDKVKILSLLLKLRQICCDPSLLYENYDGGHAKLEQCMELMENCIEAGHKILLFSQFTSMLEIIAQALSQKEISFYTLTGQTKTQERMRLVNEFNENDVSVFLISLKAGGTGLNLTGADIVIHYDPWWNLSTENQASDRVYRIGQRNSVQIYKLIVKDTIEEKICQLQQRKAELLETAVGGEGDIFTMSTDEIIQLL